MRDRPRTLRGLEGWASRKFRDETPNLDHSAVIDEGGSPTMAAAARRYLGLMGPDSDRADDWVRIASRTDEDGFYRTPLRRALSTFPFGQRMFLRDLIPGMYANLELSLLHGVPEWCVPIVAHRSLLVLWDRYLDKPVPERGWISGRSDAQRDAESVVA